MTTNAWFKRLIYAKLVSLVDNSDKRRLWFLFLPGMSIAYDHQSPRTIKHNVKVFSFFLFFVILTTTVFSSLSLSPPHPPPPRHWLKIFPLQSLLEATDLSSFPTETHIIPPPSPFPQLTPGVKYLLVTVEIQQTNNSLLGPWPGSTVTGV